MLNILTFLPIEKEIDVNWLNVLFVEKQFTNLQGN